MFSQLAERRKRKTQEATIYLDPLGGPWVDDASQVAATQRLFKSFASSASKVSSLIPAQFEAYCEVRRADGQEGSPTEQQSDLLLSVLSRTADANNVFFLLWDGYEGICDDGGSGAAKAHDTLSVGGRWREWKHRHGFWPPIKLNHDHFVQIDDEHHYLLGRGSLVDARMSARPTHRTLPDFMWAADMSWFVAADMDLSSTYVGGSKHLVEALMSIKDLKASPASQGTDLKVSLPY